ncbi:MAG: hypothetical protein ABR549_02545 [Mycobacteriales bacterium]
MTLALPFLMQDLFGWQPSFEVGLAVPAEQRHALQPPREVLRPTPASSLFSDTIVPGRTSAVAVRVYQPIRPSDR